jgi:hypothetical protein
VTGEQVTITAVCARDAMEVHVTTHRTDPDGTVTPLRDGVLTGVEAAEAAMLLAQVKMLLPEEARV